MNKIRPFLPELLMVAIMVAVSLIYMSPVFEGKTLMQGDVIHAQDQMAGAKAFQEETGVYPGWTNNAFSGMPTYQLISPPSNNVYHWLFRALKIWLPGYSAAILFLSLLGFYVLLRTLKLTHWLALAGALAFGLGSHHIQLIITGHVSKIYSIAFMAPVIAGMFLVFKRKYLAGGLLTAIGLGIQISTNHVQISYYLGMMVILYFLVELVFALREKYLDHFMKASGILLISLILAVLPNMTMLLTTYEYARETTRGNSAGFETEEGEKTGKGLDLDYMTAWSYGVGETLNLFIPNLYGGSNGNLDTDSEFYKDLRRRGVQNPERYLASAPTYWGGQPFTAGPHYVGAITFFLAILGLLLVRGPRKWWLALVILLSVMLAWGSNFLALTEFFARHVPLYAKFRDMTNNLIMTQFAIPLLAFLGIRSWLADQGSDQADLMRKLYIATGIAGGIALVFSLMPGLFLDFSSRNDAALENAGWDLAPLIADREMLARQDAFRSLIFVLLGAGVLFLTRKSQIKPAYLYMAMAFLILIDLWVVDRRYLSTDDFVSKRQLENSHNPSAANQFILQDASPHYRVLDMDLSRQGVDPFRNSRASRYHYSVGGYHAAKLGRYQQIIDRYLTPELATLFGSLGNATGIEPVHAAMGNMKLHKMLNTKYIILYPQQQPLLNPHAIGPAWLVDSVRIVQSEAEEISGLADLDPEKLALVHPDFRDQVAHLTPVSPSPAVEEIRLETYDPNYIKYQARTAAERLAVFSEVWYPHGWKAYVNGEEQEIIRVNYLFRGLVLPAGENLTVEFFFKPSSLKVGQVIALISSLLVIMLIVGYGYRMYRTNSLLRSEPNTHSPSGQ